ncbi:hypothetical protein [Chitinilyticum piscinae]|uniref:Calcineurin-like phosphoesterase domain-containing protein n=1 Tax=Chitinilyticum piscinae TaxID=2866724 RepID=A0A8J7KCU6_9NEIS|nr:hypothetical protein [Chitinilyticum piscinae]MBE9608109.1 hypothetical protein [Chitinilyticum piscinae]
MKLRCAALLLALGTLPLAQARTTATEPFSFGLWGDMPYEKNADASKIPALLASLNQSDIRFSIYDGDLKDGSSECKDSVFAEARAMFNQLRRPVVYVPGDNEWTDCHRSNNGGYSNLERLAYLRKTMFSTPASFGKTTLSLEMQGSPGEKFAENTRFSHGPVVFAHFNIPGSNNNMVLDDKDCSKKSARTPADCAADNAEYQERDATNIAWLKESFAKARSQHARGIVLVFQADPGFDLPETEDQDESKLPMYSGYRNFISSVISETEQFDGQVLLVHGDTHYFKVDKPLYSPTRLLPNLTRVETFGSPLVHWVHVSVDPKRPELFTVRPVIVKQ